MEPGGSKPGTTGKRRGKKTLTIKVNEVNAENHPGYTIGY